MRDDNVMMVSRPVAVDASPILPVDFSRLRVLDDGVASLCLVQLPPLPGDEAAITAVIHEDRSRPSSLATLQSLLVSADGGQPMLYSHSNGGTPILLLPEYALASSDWAEVDGLVRRFPGNLVLIVGFGATSGAVLNAWKTVVADGGTERLLPEPRIKNGCRYNGGWCWVRHGDETTCVTFLKTFPQQRDEAAIVDGTGKHTVMLAFMDLLLFPNICADLLKDTDQSPRCRIAAQVRQQGESRPVLVTGSLYEDHPAHEIWQAGLASLIDGCGEARDRVIAVLANRAIDKVDRDEPKDRWRSLSGVYAAKSLKPDILPRQAATRAAHHSNFAGGVVRRTDACAVFGDIRWAPYRSTSGQWRWGKCKSGLIGDDGMVGPVSEDTPSRAGYEVGRFLRRHKPNDVHRQMDEGLDHFHSDLVCGPSTRVERLGSTALGGIAPKEFDPDHLHEYETTHHLSQVLLTLAYLAHPVTGMVRQERTNHTGQLRWNTEDANVLVWSYDGSAAGLKAEVADWAGRNPDHPPLLVVAKAINGNVKAESIKADRKTRLSYPPEPAPEKQDYVTQPRGRGTVASFPLMEVVEAWDLKCEEPGEVLHKMAETLREARE